MTPTSRLDNSRSTDGPRHRSGGPSIAAPPKEGKLADLFRESGAEGCYVFSLEPPGSEAAAYARFFNPTMGIIEDPATGTAAGPLGALLLERGLAPHGWLKIEQGTALGRRSLIDVEVFGAHVSVRSRCVLEASGTLAM